MSDIYKVNESLSTTEKIKQLNDMILELEGLIEKGRFNKNEITAIYTDLGSSYTRKFLRDQSLGHTLATYSGWSHVQAETGYSIWKFTPTTYTYSSLNRLYFDDKVLENRGEADSEAVTTFDKVFLYNGSTYIDDTTEAGSESGTAFSLMDATGEYLYVGLASTFTGVSFEFSNRGSGYTLHWEYWNGSAWSELDISGAIFSDDTSNFESDGRCYWDLPYNWNLGTVNSVANKYWIRVSTTSTPTTTATAYLVIPSNSVISLLELSSSETLEEDWAWCTYGNDIYVTIRNAGVAAYEGNAFITSSSTAINKQNFFISNHEYSTDYQDSTY